MSFPKRLALVIFLIAMMCLSGVVMHRHLDSPGWGAMAGELILALFWAMGLSAGVFALGWSAGVLTERAGAPPLSVAARQARTRRRILASSLLLAIALTAVWRLPAEIQRRRAADPQATPEELRRIYSEPGVRGRIEVLAALAAHRNTPSDVLFELAVTEDSDFDRPRRNLVALLQGPPRSIRQIVASRSATPPEALTQLADNGSPGVMKAVAGNPRTPPATLLRLAHDSSPGVLRPLALNPGAPAEALELLAGHSDEWVRAGVAAHAETPPSFLRRLATDPSRIVRHRVATNSHASLTTLELLAADPDAEIKRLAQEARDRITG